MRIIGGGLKGRRLFSVRGERTRPTADPLREAIFNILSARVRDTVVLDLFAGTGALGIEALSRGARQAVLIDKDRSAIEVIRRNIELCRLAEKARAIRWDVSRNLNCIRGHRPPFSLVLMDPPYSRNLIAPALALLDAGGCLEKNSLIVAEHTPAEAMAVPEAFSLVDRRTYGKRLVSFLGYMV